MSPGVPFVIIGAEGEGAHGPNERVKLKSIEQYAAVLTEFLRQRQPAPMTSGEKRHVES